MDIIRNELKELGFNEIIEGEYPFGKYTYHLEKSVYRDATYNIWVYSHSNWYFDIEIAKYSHETGVEGYEKHFVFKGHISDLNEFNIILKTTNVKYIIDYLATV